MNRPTEAEILAKSARNKAAWSPVASAVNAAAQKAEAGDVVRVSTKPDGKVKITYKQAVDRAQSNLEVMFSFDIENDALPAAERNYRAIEGRKFEIDFAWPALKFGCEVQGMCHRIRERFEADIEKRALLALDGWTILEVSGKTIRDGRAVEWLKAMLKAKGACE